MTVLWREVCLLPSPITGSCLLTALFCFRWVKGTVCTEIPALNHQRGRRGVGRTCPRRRCPACGHKAGAHSPGGFLLLSLYATWAVICYCHTVNFRWNRLTLQPLEAASYRSAEGLSCLGYSVLNIPKSSLLLSGSVSLLVYLT